MHGKYPQRPKKENIRVYIAIDGINGCGKSKQANRLYGYAASKLGEDSVVLTKEPTQGIYGRQIYKILKEKIQTSPVEMAMLFALDRREHHRNVVDPAIQQGKLVIGDRCVASSYVYQYPGIGSSKFMEAIHSDMPKYCPDVLVVIDVEPEKARLKVLSRGEPDLHEENTKQELEARIRYLNIGNYLSLVDFIVVEQLDTPELTFSKIVSEVSKYVELQK